MQVAAIGVLPLTYWLVITSRQWLVTWILCSTCSQDAIGHVLLLDHIEFFLVHPGENAVNSCTGVAD